MTGERDFAPKPGERRSDGRSRAVKVAVVLVGVVNLAAAGVLIGVPGFQTTLDAVPGPAEGRTTPPAAALTRSPAATPVPLSPNSGTPAPSAPAASAPVRPAPTPTAPPSSAGVPTTPGAVQPQGAARTAPVRGPRARSVRPQAVRPRKKTVVIDTVETGLTSPPASSPTGTPASSPTGTPATSPTGTPAASQPTSAAQRRSGRPSGRAPRKVTEPPHDDAAETDD
ncbi:hypothetical protein [Nonomuraea sp. SYSU D8015]|uniref:hypothetical protein n=1 Tax=Nonomuraea sp. SYSU D8015 TaxID=2593644 RepID=UPI0016614A3E|nr:hypothetical protein [Nonomuraea sp. SYSU D8015]